MDKRIKLIVTGAIILIAAGFAYMLTSSDTKTETNSSTSTRPPSSSNKPAQQTGSGSYVTYKEGIIEQTSGTKVLFFHAPWCPQCRDLEDSINSGTIPTGVTIIKVDYDSMRDLRKKYGVTIQTTLVRVSDNGELEKKYVAYDEPSLESLKRNLL
ncbi:thioredoxin family protein [Candidatus Saccharibacteria bacterium]|nr:thioredoxin family protein [Candidatus Saccharibacteria bacterium]